MNIEMIREILGWCTVINFGVLLIWFLFFMLAGNLVRKWHSKFFAMPEDSFNAIHYKGIMYYKLAITLFNLVPYLALVIISCKYVG